MLNIAIIKLYINFW